MHPTPDPRRRAVIGLVVVIVLVVGGLLLVHALQNMSRIQDCAMSGSHELRADRRSACRQLTAMRADTLLR